MDWPVRSLEQKNGLSEYHVIGANCELPAKDCASFCHSGFESSDICSEVPRSFIVAANLFADMDVAHHCASPHVCHQER